MSHKKYQRPYEHDRNISRMSQSLAETFVLPPDHCRRLLKIYHVTTMEEVFELWIREFLRHPDDELAQMLLPPLVTRFNLQLEQIRREEWLC